MADIDRDILETTAVAVMQRVPTADPKRPWSLYHNTVLMGHFPTEKAARDHSQTLLQDSHDERRKEVPLPQAAAGGDPPDAPAATKGSPDVWRG